MDMLNSQFDDYVMQRSHSQTRPNACTCSAIACARIIYPVEVTNKCWIFVLVYFVYCDCSCAVTKRKDMEKLSVDQVCYQLNRYGIDKASIKVIQSK